MRGRLYPEAESMIVNQKKSLLEKETNFILWSKENKSQVIVVMWVQGYNKRLYYKKILSPEKMEEEQAAPQFLELSQVTAVESVSVQEKSGLEEHHMQCAFNVVTSADSICVVANSKEEKVDWMDAIMLTVGNGLEKMTSASMAKEVSELLDIKMEIELIKMQQAPPVPPQPANLNFSK